MKIEVNIDKRYFIILISFIAILGVVLITNAYGEGNPEVIGHSWNDIGDKPAGFADDIDNVDDADSDSTNELQDLNNVLSRGNNAGGKKITNLGAPTSSSDAATMYFVENYVSNNAGGTGSLSCRTEERNSCSSGVLVAGGCECTGTLYGSYPDGNSWRCDGDTDDDWCSTYVRCCELN